MNSKKFVKILQTASILTVVFAMSMFFGCKAKTQETFKPESPSVSVAPPTDGSVANDYTWYENLSFIMGKFANANYYSTKTTTDVKANSLGVINVSQYVLGSKDYKDGILITSTISKCSTSLAPSKAIQRYYGDKFVLSRTAKSSDPDSWDGYNTQWTDSAPYERVNFDEYQEIYGLWATEFTDFIINENTILNGSQQVVDGNYVITLDLCVSGENDATYYYKKQMVTMGELSATPVFESLKLTITFTSDWTVLQTTTQEVYQSQKGLITANLNATSTTTFSFDEATVDVSAYENYFKHYVNEQEHLTAQTYLEQGLANVLNGQNVQLDVTYQNLNLQGFMSFAGETQNLTLVRTNIGGAQLNIEEGSMYVFNGGIQTKVDLKAASENVTVAFRGDNYYEQDDKVIVEGRFTSAGIDMPLTFVFTKTQDGVNFEYAQNVLTVNEKELVIKLTPTAEKFEFAQPDKQNAVDITPIIKDVLDFVNTGTFVAEVNYVQDLLDLNVVTTLAVRDNAGELGLSLDTKVTINQYENTQVTNEDGTTTTQKTVKRSHFIHLTYIDNVCYTTYSIFQMDGENALKLKLDTTRLQEAILEVVNTLKFFGVETDNLPQISLVPTITPDRTTAKFEGAVDENGNNKLIITDTYGTDTISIAITAAKSGAPEVVVPADADTYYDMQAVYTLFDDLVDTTSQIMTGFDLSFDVAFDLLGGNVLADYDGNIKIATDADKDIVMVLTINVHAEKNLYYGDATTQLVVKNDVLYFTKTNYTQYEGETEVTLETPIVEYKAMTSFYARQNLSEVIFYLLNMNEATLYSFVDSLKSMIKPTEITSDIGQMLTFSSNETEYRASLDLTKLMNFDMGFPGTSMQGSLDVALGRLDTGTKVYLKTLDITADMGVDFFGTRIDAINAHISVVNNNPGVVVKVDDAATLISTLKTNLGYTDDAAFMKALNVTGKI